MDISLQRIDTKGWQSTLILIGIAFFCVGHMSPAAAEMSIVWDESLDGDLSNEFGKPTMIDVTQPGEYSLRVTTGPMIPALRSEPAVMPKPLLDTLKRMDKNQDSHLQHTEARANFLNHFELYDQNSDGKLAFDEIALFEMQGDGHDFFDFIQADGINLVSIIVNKYTSGGIRNDASVFVIIDEKAGQPEESRGIEMTDKEVIDFEVFAPDIIAGIVRAGSEIYDQFDLWKAYRRNDSSCYFRIGEGQEKANTELIFVFE
jgi:hypothetical protein